MKPKVRIGCAYRLSRDPQTPYRSMLEAYGRSGYLEGQEVPFAQRDFFGPLRNRLTINLPRSYRLARRLAIWVLDPLRTLIVDRTVDMDAIIGRTCGLLILWVLVSLSAGWL